MGLVNLVASADQLRAQVRRLCDDMLLTSPESLRLGKAAIYGSMSIGLAEALEAEGAAQSACYTSDDHREGVDCFLEKRPPVFTGK